MAHAAEGEALSAQLLRAVLFAQIAVVPAVQPAFVLLPEDQRFALDIHLRGIIRVDHARLRAQHVHRRRGGEIVGRVLRQRVAQLVVRALSRLAAQHHAAGLVQRQNSARQERAVEDQRLAALVLRRDVQIERPPVAQGFGDLVTIAIRCRARVVDHQCLPRRGIRLDPRPGKQRVQQARPRRSHRRPRQRQKQHCGQ